MPATFTPISNDVLTAVRQGDERALEQLFREHYHALLAEASANLDDATFAPRIVESAMLRAWQKHQSFDTPKALEQFLHESVHEGAIRDKSRRAALHRFEGHEGVHVARTNGHVSAATVDDVWARIHATLHAPATDTEAHAQAKADLSRHAAAEHMANVAKRRSPWVSAAYLVAALGVVASVLFLLFRESPTDKVTRLLKSPDSHDVISKFGQIGTVSLDDGSKATIGADSRIVIPPSFPAQVRAVRVAGTASFEVAPAGALPFEVRLGDVAVVATGSRFSVNFDTATSMALVRVDEGAVTVRAGSSERPLAAGKSLEIDKSGVMRDASADAVNEALAWTGGRLVVVDRTLRQALEQTRRWYGIALIPSDMSLMDRKVSIDAPLDASKEMIADLEASGKMKFGWEDKTMVLYDAGAVPKANK